jgi:uncharacterized protein with HEPN domain
MQPLTRKLLDDVRDSAAFIQSQTRGLSAAQYLNDRLVRQAVERNFEIIGEAVNRLRKIDAGTATLITDADRIVAFRNVLIHGYHMIDDAEVWRVVESSLPVLLRDVDALLAPPSGSAPPGGP